MRILHDIELEACYIVYQALEGLLYLHKRGIMHRDIKPENIMLLFDGNKEKVIGLKLVDFGLAYVLKPSGRTKDTCGTPTYVAPEVLSKQSYTEIVDMWSLGIVTFILYL